MSTMVRTSLRHLRRAGHFVVLLGLALGLATHAAAQGTNATITGIVTDDQGGVLPGVTGTVRNADTGVTRDIVTETDGQYRAAALPPGRYDRPPATG